jgi:hypothetical protein
MGAGWSRDILDAEVLKIRTTSQEEHHFVGLDFLAS